MEGIDFPDSFVISLVTVVGLGHILVQYISLARDMTCVMGSFLRG